MAADVEAHMAEPLLGRGIYDLAEAARVVGRDPDTVARWTRGANPLHRIESDRIISFLDLISLWVISETDQAGSPPTTDPGRRRIRSQTRRLCLPLRSRTAGDGRRRPRAARTASTTSVSAL